MYIHRIPVKLDRNAFRSATEVGFRPVEKAEHQGCCGRIPPESGRNRNPALDSGPQQTGTKTGMCHLATRSREDVNIGGADDGTSMGAMLGFRSVVCVCELCVDEISSRSLTWLM